jgi:hypothetical protein
MVVNAFGWTAVARILFGMVIPFWLMTYFAAKAARQQTKDRKTPDRVLRYNELMDYLHAAWKKSSAEGQNGASIIASIRELKNYPEHRDLTILYLEEINVTGTSKFDDLAKVEIKDVETYLLGLKDE